MPTALPRAGSGDHAPRLGLTPPTLHLRLNLPNGGRLGPGRADLLQSIHHHGSIAAAARAMNMSYRRAWTLLASIAQDFGAPVVATTEGGAGGGGATLTPLGATLLALYRAIEHAAAAATAVQRAELAALMPRPN